MSSINTSSARPKSRRKKAPNKAPPTSSDPPKQQPLYSSILLSPPTAASTLSISAELPTVSRDDTLQQHTSSSMTTSLASADIVIAPPIAAEAGTTPQRDNVSPASSHKEPPISQPIADERSSDDATFGPVSPGLFPTHATTMSFATTAPPNVPSTTSHVGPTTVPPPNLAIFQPPARLVEFQILHVGLPTGLSALPMLSLPLDRIFDSSTSQLVAHWRETSVIPNLTHRLLDHFEHIDADTALCCALDTLLSATTDTSLLIEFSSRVMPRRRLLGHSLREHLAQNSSLVVELNLHFCGKAARLLSHSLRSATQPLIMDDTIVRRSTPIVSTTGDTEVLNQLLTSASTISARSCPPPAPSAGFLRAKGLPLSTPSHSTRQAYTGRHSSSDNDVHDANHHDHGPDARELDTPPDHVNSNSSRRHANRRDPSWSSNNRAGFRVPLGTEALLAQRSLAAPRGQRIGFNWTHYLTDPQMDRSNIEVDYETGLIPPWLAPHPDENDPVLNFPVRIDQIFYDEELFLSGLSREWLPKNAILFQKNFPIYLNSESTSLLAYYNRIVTFCLEWRVFVPPLHTLRVGNPLGVWYAKLSALTKSQITSTFSSLLALSLRQSQTKLISDRILGPFVGLGVCGYDMLYNLAVQGRHPILYKSAKDPHVPEQTENTAIPAYINDWIAYIHLRSLSGYHLSDRYFIQQFISGLHSTLKSSLGDWLQMQVDRRPLGKALPDSFAPHCLLVLLMQRAEFCDSMDMIHSTPRSYARPPQQQLLPRGPPQQPPLYIRSLDENPDDTALTLQAIGATTTPAVSAPPRTAVCFMCGSYEHQLNTCPRMAAVRANNYARRMLQRELASPGTADARPLRQVAFQPSAEEDATLVDASSAPVEDLLGLDVDFQ